MRSALLFVLVGCSAPRVEVTDAGIDASIDVVEDTAPYVYPDAKYSLPDGAVCSGHDEDGDGVPDGCDDCPNIVNPTQSKSALAPEVGTICAASGPFSAAKRRALFDPFLRLGSKWIASGGPGAFTVADAAPDMLSGGRAFRELHVAVARLDLGARTVVVTLPIALHVGIGDGQTGVIARASNDLRHFYACGIRGTGRTFELLRTPDGGCPDAEDCPLVSVAEKKVPSLVDPNDVGVRFSVADTADGGTLECRLYSPGNLVTLSADPAQYAITVNVPKQSWLASGEVGVFSRWLLAKFPSIDVVASP